MGGRSQDGKLISVLKPTCEKPTFSREAKQYGLEHLVKLSSGLWD